ncbi:MAG: M23 family metallopeptidase, partial [Patescibacteria group bacterium]|nr:M23 family metallopeptidase [Patescibacteria group bacterium]
LTASTVIKPGRILIILPIDDSIQHTMAKNEKLEEVVKKYRGDLNETLAFNGWPSGYEPEVGTTVIILNVEREPLTNSGTAVRRGGGRFENYYGDSYLSPITYGYYISQGPHGYKNSGIDMAVALGTPILSVASGCVIVSRDDGWWGGFGRYAVIENSNKTQALYAHMNRDIVSVGQCVARGQVIGYVGSTGRSTGAHLHFELRK